MVFDEIFRPFVEGSPVSVMFRGTLENILSTDRMDRLFGQVAQRQVSGELLFSSCVKLLGLVVTRVQPSVNASYRACRQDVAVSVQAVYQKLAGIEPCVCETLVRETAGELGAIVETLSAAKVGPLPGYDVRIVDGNHLQGTQRRLKEMRGVGDAPLPGHTLAVLDPQRELIEDLVVCEDGHANQRPLFAQLLPKVQPGQCWIADRDFSTKDFLFGVKRRRGYFLIRQHRNLAGENVGRKRRLGSTDTGIVYEQKLRVLDNEGRELIVRRITLKLNQPTREGETEIYLLSNLPQKVRGIAVATAYLDRWNIEAAFHKLTTVLRCELNTLGYPDAALFGFSLAVVMYNALSVVMAAVREAHPQAVAKAAQQQKKISFYYLAHEISSIWQGMRLVIASNHWTAAFAGKTPRQMARILRQLARKVRIETFLTNRQSNKKRKRPRTINHGGHFSTYRMLQQRKTNAKNSSL